MSSLAEIESAVTALPQAEKVELLAFLSDQIAPKTASAGEPRFLDHSKYRTIDGLPSDLSVNTRAKARELLLAKHNAKHC